MECFIIINVVCGVGFRLIVVSSSAFAYVFRRRAAAGERASIPRYVSQAEKARRRGEGRELFELIFDLAKEAASVLLLLALARARCRRLG